jgi:hypothetical protein
VRSVVFMCAAFRQLIVTFLHHAYSHGHASASIVRESNAPSDWRAALMILICLYAAAFGLVRGLFERDADREHERHAAR